MGNKSTGQGGRTRINMNKVKKAFYIPTSEVTTLSDPVLLPLLSQRHDFSKKTFRNTDMHA